MAATPYARRSFAGGAISTTVPTGMASGDTTFTVAAATNWSFANNFYVVVDRGLSTEEKILCSGISSLVVTVASSGRGADGTSAQSHVAGCTVQVCHVAQDDDEANQVVSAVLGQSGAAKGDILAMLSAAGPNTLTRVPIGTSNQILGVSAGLPAYASLAAAQVEPIFTAAGQLILGTGSGTGELLTAGATGTILTSGGTASVPTWSASSSALTLIASNVLAGATANVTFSAIPGTYSHLQLIAVARSSVSAETDIWEIQLSTDTSAHYDIQYVAANTITVQGSHTFGATSFNDGGNGGLLGASATANVPSRLKMDIPLYAGTTFQKVVGFEFGGIDAATSASDGWTYRADGLWRNTAAVTSIKLFTGNAANFVTGSAFYLYGIA